MRHVRADGGEMMPVKNLSDFAQFFSSKSTFDAVQRIVANSRLTLFMVAECYLSRESFAISTLGSDSKHCCV